MRCAELHGFIAQELYFVIHTPRQVGKTTLIQDFVRQLNEQGDYLAIYCTLETAQGIPKAGDGIPVVVRALKDATLFSSFASHKPFADSGQELAEAALRSALAHYCAAIDMFDEV